MTVPIDLDRSRSRASASIFASTASLLVIAIVPAGHAGGKEIQVNNRDQIDPEYTATM